VRIEDIRSLFGYNTWANARILDAAARVPAEEFTRAALGPCRLHDTLRHILQAEVFWRSEWQAVADASERLPAVFPTVEALRARWAEEDQALAAFLGTLRDEDLRRPMIAPPSPPETLGQQLQHVVNHGTQHRSEVALLLTDLGQSPGDMDFLIYLNSATTAWAS
jgi:uncharacterized damage-inducible protein DinB